MNVENKYSILMLMFCINFYSILIIENVNMITYNKIQKNNIIYSRVLSILNRLFINYLYNVFEILVGNNNKYT